MEPGSARETVVKKIYFIKRAREGEELITLLKNKFKVLDAIRDVVSWFDDGKEFLISLRDLGEGDSDQGPEHVFEISQAAKLRDATHCIVESIACIIGWLDRERVFDIALSPRHVPGEEAPPVPPVVMN